MLNVYNYREVGNYTFTGIDNYFNEKVTKEKYSVPLYIEFADVNITVNEMMANDYMQS